MNQIDIIGFTGVAILLLAYFMNMTGKIARDSKAYLYMNFVGAAIACLASVLMKYVPFILLEACWTIVSLIGIVNLQKGKKNV
jgi:hypothetical protein